MERRSTFSRGRSPRRQAAAQADSGALTSLHSRSLKSALGTGGTRAGQPAALAGWRHHAISCAPQRTSSEPSWQPAVQ